MEQWLKVKTAGLPRWAWLLILSGAVGAGIYLRTRSQEEQYGPEEEEVESPTEGELSYYDGTEQGGGLAAAGLVGPAQGQITPVEAPVIPEGVVDIIGSQNETLSNAIGALAERSPAEGGERVETLVEREGEGQAEREQVRREEREERAARHKHHLTGGGSPQRKPHHKPPKKAKAKKPKQNHPKQAPKRKRNPGGRRPRRSGVRGAVKA